MKRRDSAQQIGPRCKTQNRGRNVTFCRAIASSLSLSAWWPLVSHRLTYYIPAGNRAEVANQRSGVLGVPSLCHLGFGWLIAGACWWGPGSTISIRPAYLTCFLWLWPFWRGLRVSERMFQKGFFLTSISKGQWKKVPEISEHVLAGTELLCPLLELQTFQPQWLKAIWKPSWAVFFFSDGWGLVCTMLPPVCLRHGFFRWRESLLFFQLGVFGVTREKHLANLPTCLGVLPWKAVSFLAIANFWDWNFILQKKESRKKVGVGKFEAMLWAFEILQGLGGFELEHVDAASGSRASILPSTGIPMWSLLGLAKHQGSRALRVNNRSIVIQVYRRNRTNIGYRNHTKWGLFWSLRFSNRRKNFSGLEVWSWESEFSAFKKKPCCVSAGKFGFPQPTFFFSSFLKRFLSCVVLGGELLCARIRREALWQSWRYWNWWIQMLKGECQRKGIIAGFECSDNF